jgi:hypothetical protein
MNTRIVRTQAELDQALSDQVGFIDIESSGGVWLNLFSNDSATVTAYGSATVRAYGSATVRAYGSATVTAYGSATVTAYGSATVTAYGSATVTAYGSATVRAYDSATVRAYGSATVRAYDSATVTAYDSATVTAYDSATVTAYGSATVTAYGSATVRAYDSATVTAYGSATVRAYGSATVTAYGSATVRAYGSATVRAYDSATVTASESATVRASKYVAVHLHSARATITGGVLIDVSKVDKHTPESWCDWQGVDITDHHAVVYKAVNNELISSHGMAYPIGATVTDPNWSPTDECGAGLHFGATPHHAQAYYRGGEQPRFLACRIALADAVGITGQVGDTAKIKARECVVLHEVNADGNKVTA